MRKIYHTIRFAKLHDFFSMCVTWTEEGNSQHMPDFQPLHCCQHFNVECVWNVTAHGKARKGKWRGNWRMEWVASTLTLPRNVVYPALLPLMRTPRLPVVDWTDAPADLNELVRFGERRNLVSACVPSRFKRTIPTLMQPAILRYALFIILCT